MFKKEFKNNKTVYIAGDLMHKGNRMLREMEKQDIINLGMEYYNPQDNDSINSKKDLSSEEALAEKIVREDKIRMWESDLATIDYLPGSIGTTVEIGIYHGMKENAAKIKEVLNNPEMSKEDMLDEINYICDRVLGKKIFVQHNDIRRDTQGAEYGDRRSFSNNAFLYGVVLELTNGVGFQSWNEIVNELKQIKEENK